jgi:polysaccharide export outer membrane protein
MSKGVAVDNPIRLRAFVAILFLTLVCLGQDRPGRNEGKASTTRSNAAQQTDGPPDAEPAQVEFGLQQRNPRYRLQPGDVIDLSFEFSPEFNQTVTVQPDGYITLRGIGDLHVAGETTPQLTKNLRSSYSNILFEPAIAVVLQNFERPYFVAGGQVTHPGKYELRGDTTVTQAIAMAGGFNTSIAKHSQVLLFRRVSGDWAEARILDIKKMFGSKDLSEDLHLQPGDMIFVPQNRISKIERFLPTPHALINLNPTKF